MSIEESTAGKLGVKEMNSDAAFVGGELDEVFFVCDFS